LPTLLDQNVYFFFHTIQCLKASNGQNEAVYMWVVSDTRRRLVSNIYDLQSSMVPDNRYYIQRKKKCIINTLKRKTPYLQWTWTCWLYKYYSNRL